MEGEKKNIEPLFERIETYSETSFELFKLKAVDKSADIASTFLSRAMLIPVFLMFTVMVNVGVALWLGDIFGKLYNGFFCVAGFYVVLGFVLYCFRGKIKKHVGDTIILHILN